MLFKCTGANGETYGGYRWPLSHDGKPGEWTPELENIRACERGYHLCEDAKVLSWLNQEIYIAEVHPNADREDGNDKIVVSSARLVRKLDKWNEKNARLFACWCAEQALPVFERQYPDDNRPRAAIEVARRYANGEATHDELRAASAAASAAAGCAAGFAASAAAGAAASAAAGGAACAAAWAAAGAADNTYARVAASAIAVDAAWDASRATAWDAASAATKAAQFEKLQEIFD